MINVILSPKPEQPFLHFKESQKKRPFGTLCSRAFFSQKTHKEIFVLSLVLKIGPVSLEKTELRKVSSCQSQNRVRVVIVEVS